MHSAVRATHRLRLRRLGKIRAVVGALALICSFSAAPQLAAQPADEPAPAALPDQRTQRFDSPDEVQALLAAARVAMEAGRVDEPEDESAWSYYRRIVEKYPDNEDAKLGLLAVQESMLERAVAFAEEQDFDAAEQLMETASSVLEDQRQVEQARAIVTRIRSSRAGTLELQAIQLMDAGNFEAAERVLIDLVALGGEAVRLRHLRQRMEEARNYGGFKPGQVIRDRFISADLWAPEAVVIPAGSYLMGSPADEPGRVENEAPRHRVTFRRGFALGRHEVTSAEFGAFVSASGFRTTAERSHHSTVYHAASGRLLEKKGVHWEMDYEGKPAKPEEPVLHVSWNDAQAYVRWLASETGKSYRLPSEAEFEYALRAGSNTRFWWGNGSPKKVVENLTGELDSSGSQLVWKIAFSGYTDRYWGPAPVTSFEPNPFGLFDMGGNVSEWVSDCWHDTYVRAPLDGTPWINPGCDQRLIRGGYWASLPDQTRSAYRRYATPDFHDARVGIRIARDL